jgi:diguanylate cyclase (GGDEF)-like protein
MRWLYALTAILSLLLTVPAPLSAATPPTVTLALAGTAILISSWLVTYFRRESPLVLGVVDAIGVAAFALACPTPAAAFSFAFAGLWFRALYGSVTRAVVQCAFYAGGFTLALVFFDLVPGHRTGPAPLEIMGTFPVMFLVVIVGRMLAAGVFMRAEAAGRDAAIVRFGTAMMEYREPDDILRHAGRACVDIAEATPGLRLIAVFRDAEGGLTPRTAGPFRQRLDRLPAGLLAVDGDSAVITDPEFLDAAAGERCGWRVFTIPDDPDGAWMLLGAPKHVSAEALMAVRSLSNQVTLALRNSEIRRELTRQARTDSLTGLPNRAAFTETLQDALRAGAGPVAVLFVDLDKFKPVNDGLGHRAGDELLRQVADRLTAFGGVCGRIGGDEFAIMLTGVTAEDAEDVAHAVVATVGEPVPVAGSVARVGASVGVALAEPGDGTDAEQLLHCGDMAMYRAKAAGRNRVARYDAVPAAA